MRDIKFRGQTGTTEGKKWVYGYYYKVKSFFDDKAAHFIGIIRDNHLMDFNIDKNTVGQYTGLKDKNGKEIYEGDIIKCYSEIYVVEFREDRGGFFPFACGDGCGCCEHEVAWTDRTEVIGNIYDNPDLLEKASD